MQAEASAWGDSVAGAWTMSALEKKRCSLLFGCTEKFLTETLPVHCYCVGQKQSRQWCFYFTDEMHSDCQNTSIRLKLDSVLLSKSYLRSKAESPRWLAVGRWGEPWRLHLCRLWRWPCPVQSSARPSATDRRSERSLQIHGHTFIRCQQPSLINLIKLHNQ